MANLNTLDPMKFMQLVPQRQAVIEAAEAKPLPASDASKAIACALHPARQHLRIVEVIEHGRDCKSYTLAPDEDRGTGSLAYFSAGQYLTVYLDVDGMPITRAYSISSSPTEALEGAYRLTVKYVQDCLATRYILDTWQVGSEVETSGPLGNFTYSGLRDAAHVIGVAGGSGITPFASMAKAIADGAEDFSLTVLYGSRTADGILLRDELDGLAATCEKIRFVHVLSDEERTGYEHGFVTAHLISKYAPEGEYSVFLCGPQEMYRFVDKEIEKLGIRRKFVRHELFGEMHCPEREADYPGCKAERVNVTVTIRGETRTVEGSAHDTILQTLEKAGVAMPARCRSGECGWCRSLLKSGKVYVPKDTDGRRKADLKFGYIHPCCTFPLGDVEIEASAAK